ncbi:hypothetical protein ANTQUA_LOCUS3883 [Anthophora quadrimaculata]
MDRPLPSPHPHLPSSLAVDLQPLENLTHLPKSRLWQDANSMKHISTYRIKLSHDPRMVDRLVFLYDRLRKRASRVARPDTVRHPIWPRNPDTGIHSDEPPNP